jgi:hypothetical protein
LHDGPRHIHAAAQHLKVLDTQRDHFPPAESGIREESDDLRIALDLRRQRGDRFVTEVATVGVLALRELHSIARYRVLADNDGEEL